MEIYVGCCGFSVSKRKYFSLFDAVELQDTFYNPPNIERLRRLRGEAPENFRFSMKAWQAITHPPSMRTWRRSKIKIPSEVRDKYGFLRITDENFKAWGRIDEGANALGAKVVVVQLPPSFKFSEENLERIREFFRRVGHPNYLVGIEVRGEWRTHGEALREVLERFQYLIHVTDPFRWEPIKLKEVAYFRLHGIGGKEVNYRYKYSDRDLRRLKDYISGLEGRVKEVYVLFNNIYMRDDALRFKDLINNGDQA